MALTNSLSPLRHKRKMDKQTQIYKVVPQIVSTLRRDLVFWNHLQDPVDEFRNELNNIKSDLMAEKQKRLDMEKKYRKLLQSFGFKADENDSDVSGD